MYFNIIIPATPYSPKWSLPLKFSTTNYVYILILRLNVKRFGH